MLVPLPNGRKEALLLGSEAQLDRLENAGMVSRVADRDRDPLPQVVRSVIAVGGSEATRDEGRSGGVKRQCSSGAPVGLRPGRRCSIGGHLGGDGLRCRSALLKHLEARTA